MYDQYAPFTVVQRQLGSYGIDCVDRVQAHTNWVTRLLYIEELDIVVSTSLDTTIQMYNAKQQQQQRPFTGHSKAVHSLCWCRNTKYIVSCGMARTALVWSPVTHKQIAELMGHNAAIVDVCSDERHKLLVTASADRTFKSWDQSSFKCTQTVTVDGTFSMISAIAYNNHNTNGQFI